MERFERLSNCLSEGGATVTIARWDDGASRGFDEYDGVVLSGSPDMMSQEVVQKKFGAEIEALKDAQVPVLGVCFGHQLMAHAFGSDVISDTDDVLKFVRTSLLVRDPLFSGLPHETMLLESRHEVVRALPKGFRLLARSETSTIAAMKHETRPLYGVQSHPERYTATNPAGKRLIANFVSLLR
jgi:GMP synthase (glutamine-hydrolysing)